MIELRHTDLPVPVRPAISRCGSVVRSTTSGLPATSLPRKSGIFILLGFAVGLLDHFAEADELPVLVGHFDADGVLAGDRRDDADARHAQGDRQVVGQAGDLRQPQAGFQLDLELGDDRAGFDLDDLDVEAEVLERLLQDLRLAADFFLVLFVADVVRSAAAGRAAAARSRTASTPWLSAASSCSITSSRSVRLRILHPLVLNPQRRRQLSACSRLRRDSSPLRASRGVLAPGVAAVGVPGR